ncbi:MAG: hypothetical protein ACOYO1_13445, partial [Bacteroidales bacterium]
LITPGSSTSGAYTVSYTIAASGGCPEVVATTNVNITSPPTASITYTGSPWCTSSTTQAVTLTGTGAYTGGVYSSTTGLAINTTTGLITPGLSTSGTYTVTYTIAASGGCPEVVATTNVTITSPPTASITYTGSPWCTSSTTQAVTLTGTGAYTGGVYSSTTGLAINTTTGLVTPGSSTANTYTVTYTIPASSGCPSVQTNFSITINPKPITSPIWHD